MKKRKIIFPFRFFILLLLALSVFLIFFYPQKILLKKEIPQLSLNKIPVFRGDPSLYALSQEGLSLTAESAYAIDLDSMTVFYEKDIQKSLYPASTTKMMTALVAFDNYDLDHNFSMSKKELLGNNINIKEDEIVSVRDLFAALLISSANDVAYTFAEKDGWFFDSFMEEMKEKADDLNLKQSYFVNPAGFDELGQSSSARDLLILAKEFLKNDFFKELVATEHAVISSKNIMGDSSLENEVTEYHLYNTNQLLGQIKGVRGVKTGTTELAGEVLVTLIERDGHQILISLMKSEDRYLDTEKLIAWILNNYSWEDLELEEFKEGF